MATSSFKVKEAFYTLQGEGARAGRASVFIRFSKCNLWNGKESGRDSAVCQFCDTDINGTDGQNGGTYSQDELVTLAKSLWPNMGSQSSRIKPYVVFTGGEPALQLTESLISDFQKIGFECAVESNGTLPLPTNLDWVCISPKGQSTVIIEQCDELKLVYPQVDLTPEQTESIQASFYYLSPMADYGVANSGMIIRENMQAATQYCLANPLWQMSLQTHKLLGID